MTKFYAARGDLARGLVRDEAFARIWLPTRGSATLNLPAYLLRG